MNIHGTRLRLCAIGGAMTLAAWALAAPPALGVVVIFDGFGDADVDNNGIPLEPADVDVSGAGDGDVEPYQAVGGAGSPAVFPVGMDMVNEVTAVEDSSDVGIKWFSIGQWTTSPTSPDPRASAHILSDAANALPDTSVGYYHPITGQPRVAEAIDSGLALAVESKGRTQPAAGFFGQRVELGNTVGDEVKISFDFRVWYSAPNFNDNAVNHVPNLGEFRFGVYQDTDNQLGTEAATSSATGGPAIWGEENGYFRGDNGLVGARGDHGWFVRVPMDDPDNTSFDGATPRLATTIGRINEETNDDADSNPQIMNGTSDFVAGVTEETGMPTNGISMNKVYRMSLSLKRHEDPAGNTILATATVTERSTNTSWSWSGFDTVGTPGGGDADGGFESDSWDYFVMQTAGQSTSDDFDWLIDNFTVEVIGSNEPVLNNADFDNSGTVDGRDFLIWQRGFGLAGQTGKTNGNANSDMVVDGQDLAAWAAKFGGAPGVASSGAVPEPGAGALLAAGLCGAFGARRRFVKSGRVG